MRTYSSCFWMAGLPRWRGYCQRRRRGQALKRKQLLGLIARRSAAVLTHLNRLRIADLAAPVLAVSLHQGVPIRVRIAGIALGQAGANFVPAPLPPRPIGRENSLVAV